MTILSLDLGTTHLKAGLFDLHGRSIHIASREVHTHPSPAGYVYFDPEELWSSLAGAVGEALQAALSAGAAPLQAIGIASMAETGLLLDRRTGAARTPLIPWFDPLATPQAERVRAAAPPGAFLQRGLRPSYKFSLLKLLWLKEHSPHLLEGAVWCSTADYFAYRLTGQLATDPSLASRTYAQDISTGAWDRPWIASHGLDPDLFPPILPAGQPVGLTAPGAQALGLPPGLPVVIAGHDHVAGAFAAYTLAAVKNGSQDGPAAGWAAGCAAGCAGALFDSMGTAESLIGLFPERPLEAADDRSGFAFGRHIRPGWMYWMGGLSAGGGSLEWLRGLLGGLSNLGHSRLTYAALDQLAAGVPEAPTGILYYPYISGSGSPHSDSLARGAFLGLDAAHTRGHLVRAVLEGLAFESEFIRRRAEQTTGLPIRRILAAGGGTRNPRWLQIKADVSGCTIAALQQPETTLLGAALLAVSLLAGIDAWALETLPAVHYTPDPQRHAAYASIYENGFLRLMEPVRLSGRRLD